MPVYKLLGGMRDRIPVYASTLTEDSLEEYMALADECLDKGYKAIKLHAWGRLEEDAALCRALRERVGDDIVLMYDAYGVCFHRFLLQEDLYLYHNYDNQTISLRQELFRSQQMGLRRYPLVSYIDE